jgi:Flp pilus assembly protein TadD
MEYLDLNKHTPAEFPGKLILISAREYAVGQSVGRGTRARSFTLSNTVSGQTRLTLSVRDAGHPPDKGDVTRRPIAEQAELFTYVSWVIRLEGAENQRITIGELAQTTPLDEDSPLAYADRLLNGGETEAAIAAYDQFLATTPRSATAHHNKGAALSQLGLHGRAYSHLKLALHIEPLCPQWYLSLFVGCQHCRLAHEALAVYLAMKALFPFECSRDETAILLGLDMGQPILAETLLETAPLLGPTQVSSLREAVGQHIVKKQRVETLLAVSKEEAMRRLRETGGVYAHEALREAYEIYDRDPLLATNYGLSLMRHGDTAKATEILLAQIYRRDSTLDQICLLHAAFCEASSSRFEDSLSNLEILRAWLEQQAPPDTEVNSVDVPCWTSCVIDLDGETGSIQNPSRSLELIQQLVRDCAKPIPDTLKWFAKHFDSQFVMQHRKPE